MAKGKNKQHAAEVDSVADAKVASKKRKYLVVRSFSLPKEDGGHEIIRSFQRDELRKIKTDESGKRLPNYIELDSETAIDFVEKGYIRPA